MRPVEENAKELEAHGNGAHYVGNLLQPSATDDPLTCRKHPQSSSDGICAYCLRDKLLELVCKGYYSCGEREDDDIPSNPTSTSTAAVEVVGSGSVGRISFLIQNQNGGKSQLDSTSKHKPQAQAAKPSSGNCGDQMGGNNHQWRRNSSSSSSSSVDAKGCRRKRKLWKIVRVFVGKREKGIAAAAASEFEKSDGKNEILVSDFMGVPRSRSLCSFRGGGGGGVGFLCDDEDIGGSATGLPRVSTGLMMESAKGSCFSEPEARNIISNFDCESNSAAAAAVLLPNKLGPPPKTTCSRSIFSCEDPSFIDLKLGMGSEAKNQLAAEVPGLKKGRLSASVRGLDQLFGIEPAGYFGMLKSTGIGLSQGEGEVNRCRKSRKMWRWFLNR